MKQQMHLVVKRTVEHSLSPDSGAESAKIIVNSAISEEWRTRSP